MATIPGVPTWLSNQMVTPAPGTTINRTSGIGGSGLTAPAPVPGARPLSLSAPTPAPTSLFTPPPTTTVNRTVGGAGLQQESLQQRQANIGSRGGHPLSVNGRMLRPETLQQRQAYIASRGGHPLSVNGRMLRSPRPGVTYDRSVNGSATSATPRDLRQQTQQAHMAQMAQSGIRPQAMQSAPQMQAPQQRPQAPGVIPQIAMSMAPTLVKSALNWLK